MAGNIVVKIFKLEKSTKEVKEIRMFQSDHRFFKYFLEKVASLFGFSTSSINLFWKGK